MRPFSIPDFAQSKPYCACIDLTISLLSTGNTGATRLLVFQSLPPSRPPSRLFFASLFCTSHVRVMPSSSPGISATLSIATMKNPPVSSRCGMIRTHRSSFWSSAHDFVGGHIVSCDR